MTAIHEISSGVSDNTTSESRKFVDYVETIGKPSDPVATSVSDPNSAFSLMKGILAELGVAAGSGAGDVNNNANIYPDLIRTLGEPDDAAAVSVSVRRSAISVLKGICSRLGL